MILAAILILCQAAQPDMAERAAVLERLREYAVGYSDRLQNFTCTKKTLRTGDSTGKGKWKPLETREQELAYVNHRETYRLVKVNGAPATAANTPKRGYTTINGEFSSIANIFNPRVQAELRWDRMEGGTCVFHYRVAANSGAGMLFRQGSEQIVLAHHGSVYANCATGEVTRLGIEVEPDPRLKNGGEASIDITYGPVKIGAKEFLLPQSATDSSRQNKRLTKAEVTFENYRKYDADSSIRFDGENN